MNGSYIVIVCFLQDPKITNMVEPQTESQRHSIELRDSPASTCDGFTQTSCTNIDESKNESQANFGANCKSRFFVYFYAFCLFCIGGSRKTGCQWVVDRLVVGWWISNGIGGSQKTWCQWVVDRLVVGWWISNGIGGFQKTGCQWVVDRLVVGWWISNGIGGSQKTGCQWVVGRIVVG